MQHQNSVFHGLLKQVPWSFFDHLVDEHCGDAGVRRLNTKAQFVALLYGQLSGASSLREIETGLLSQSARLYHLGGCTVQRSTLADANRLRPHAIFSRLFARMALMGSRGLRNATGDMVRLIDSTGVRLSGMASQWARFSKEGHGRNVHGAKAHIIYDADAAMPLYLDVTPATTNDIVAAKAMPIEAGATYVFDLGYYDFAWWAELDAKGCTIVTRLKANTPLKLIQERTLPPQTPHQEGEPDQARIIHDRVGLLAQRISGARKNPLAKPVREVGITLASGKTLRLFCNDLDMPAAEIAALYKRRWAIELFFRWVKQTLKIKHFIGRSENAVRIQIAVALIAYMLIRLAHQAVPIALSPLTFARLIRINLMQRRALDQLLMPPDIPKKQTHQLEINWSLH